MSSSGYETDEDGQSQSQKEQQELLMKMFAVSMKTPHRSAVGSHLVYIMITDLEVCQSWIKLSRVNVFLQLSCKLDREFRCVELAELMTQNAVTLAIRYASRSRRMALAQRLSEIALEKANQIQEEEPEELEEEPQYSRRTSG